MKLPRQKSTSRVGVLLHTRNMRAANSARPVGWPWRYSGAENPKGLCEIYDYNSGSTLDWGYFQINTVHLERPGVNLRNLLDCKANLDFAYLLYQERGFAPWTTYNSGAYLKFLHDTR